MDTRTPSPLPKAIADGTIKLADAEIECAVLEDGTRVLSQRGIGRALKRSRTGYFKAGPDADGGAALPHILRPAALKPFFPNDLSVVLNYIEYVPRQGGRSAHGITARAFLEICDIWQRAAAAKALRPNQLHVVEEIRRLTAGLTYIGLIALIDEQTRYQERRSQNELQAILEAYVLPEHRTWVQEIPPEFTQLLCRTYGWRYSEDNRTPRYAGTFIRKVIYEQMPTPVLPKLDELNPTGSNGRRKRKHHSHLTVSHGREHFKSQLIAVMTLLRATPPGKKEFFWRLFERNFGNQPDFDLGDIE